MYKVFIDNSPNIYQLDNEQSLLEAFSDHEFIEAAGGMVRRGNAFLFIKRHGMWDIPKGKLEEGESPEIGAIREIEEECGLVAPRIVDHLINTWHTYETKKGKKVLKKTYWYLLDEAEITQLVPQEEEGITEVGYFNLDKFGEIRSNTYLSIIDVMDTIEGHLNV